MYQEIPKGDWPDAYYNVISAILLQNESGAEVGRDAVVRSRAHPQVLHTGVVRLDGGEVAVEHVDVPAQLCADLAALVAVEPFLEGDPQDVIGKQTDVDARPDAGIRSFGAGRSRRFLALVDLDGLGRGGDRFGLVGQADLQGQLVEELSAGLQSAEALQHLADLVRGHVVLLADLLEHAAERPNVDLVAVGEHELGLDRVIDGLDDLGSRNRGAVLGGALARHRCVHDFSVHEKA